ncbi:MAG: cysteine-rich CWC family protein [Proteobacteria bacterium]|nr:cysteine-rich CWC family protein [Pseudomonadota bacterium]
MTKPSPNTCPRCGATFACGMQTGSEPCWCTELPALHLSRDQVSACYCPACLKQLIEVQLEKSASS